VARDTKKRSMSRNQFYGLMPFAASLFAEGVVFEKKTSGRRDFIVTKIKRDSNI